VRQDRRRQKPYAAIVGDINSDFNTSDGYQAKLSCLPGGKRTLPSLDLAAAQLRRAIPPGGAVRSRLARHGRWATDNHRSTRWRRPYARAGARSRDECCLPSQFDTARLLAAVMIVVGRPGRASASPVAHADNKRLNNGVVANVYTVQHQAGCTTNLQVNPPAPPRRAVAHRRSDEQPKPGRRHRIRRFPTRRTAPTQRGSLAA